MNAPELIYSLDRSELDRPGSSRQHAELAARLQASEPAHIAPDTEPQNEGSRRVALQRYLDELAYDSEAEEQQVDSDAEMYDSD